MDPTQFVFVPLQSFAEQPVQAQPFPGAFQAGFSLPPLPSFAPFYSLPAFHAPPPTAHVPSAALSHIEALLRLETGEQELKEVKAESSRAPSPLPTASVTSSSPSPTPREVNSSSAEGDKYLPELGGVGVGLPGAFDPAALAYAHMPFQLYPDERNEGGAYVCPEQGCNHVYRFKGDLKHHVQVKHPHFDPTLISKPQSTKDGKPFPCPRHDCRCGFARRHDLLRHLRNKHPELYRQERSQSDNKRWNKADGKADGKKEASHSD